MRIVGILTLVLSVLISNIAYANYQGFEVKSWQDCTQQSICDTIRPKEWTEPEALFLKNTLNFFSNHGLQNFLLEIQNLGFKSFERSSKWYELVFNPNNPQNLFSLTEKGSTHAITLDMDKKIVIMDPFFDSPIKRDPKSKANMKAITLLHELAHAYDFQGKYSSSFEFQELAGFKMNEKSNFNILKFSKNSPSALETLRTEVSVLHDKKQFLKIYNLERNYGIERGVPRYYSTLSTGEAFADIVSFIYFDKTSPKYMNPALIDYIDRNVLRGARAY